MKYIQDWKRAISIFILLLLGFSFITLQPLASAQSNDVDWNLQTPDTSPAARRAHGIAYDSESDLMVLFSGGYISQSSLVKYGDTWTYDTNINSWNNVTPEVNPPSGGAGGFEYDSESDRVILFGGVKLTEPYSCWNETWAYDTNSNTWENMAPGVCPSARASHGMTYDSESDVIVLYGGMPPDTAGQNGRGTAGDTWIYDYNTNTWTNMSPGFSPDYLYAFGFVYDSESDRTILFGGRFRNSTVTEERNETWAYDYNTNTWTNMNPSVAPPIRSRFGMTYHAAWDKIILFGGDTENPDLTYSDTWTYDYNTNTWTQLDVENHPSSRVYASLTYDSESECIVLFGGMTSTYAVFDETWILEEKPPVEQPLIDPVILALLAGVILVIVILAIFSRKR
ncbi:MAG: Kelch repeat-containing protein [Candidatus Thorarchaeota archaeon]